MARAFLLLILSAAVAVSPMANALRSQIRTNLQFENGESVEVEWEGQWFRSMVNATVDAGVKISYDAGGAEVIPSAELVTESGKLQAMTYKQRQPRRAEQAEKGQVALITTSLREKCRLIS